MSVIGPSIAVMSLGGGTFCRLRSGARPPPATKVRPQCHRWKRCPSGGHLLGGVRLQERRFVNQWAIRPMQNIGAYGVEIKSVFHSLDAFLTEDKTWASFSLEECQFGYRESIFKRALRNKAIISSVTFRLKKTPAFNTSYGAIEQELEKMGVRDLTLKSVSDAVISIRQSKLPDPKKIGNSGSFFKNPVIDQVHFESLKSTFPEIVGYPAGDRKVKVAAGWLIEHAGFKGKSYGTYGVHDRQALVLVNHGGALGSDIYNLSEEIIQAVFGMYQIPLEREVNII